MSDQDRQPDTRHALIAVNSLANYAGAEVSAIEWALALRDLGYSPLLAARLISYPVKDSLDRAGLRACDLSDVPASLEFDLVWSLHFTLHGLPADVVRSAGRIVTAHLSPYQELEQPSPQIENRLSDAIVANSAETRDHLVETGVDPGRIVVQYNAVPDSFFEAPFRPGSSTGGGQLLLISNHPPAELSRAVRRLRARGFRTRTVGLRGTEKLIGPSDFEGVDAVLTIGKSVQMAMAMGVPVYCYDHFGGPGWLSSANLERAEYYNFSGRCCRTRREPGQIEDEIAAGLAAARDEARGLRDHALAQYRLNDFLRRLLRDLAGTSNARGEDRGSVLSSPEFRTEQTLVRLFDASFRQYRRFRPIGLLLRPSVWPAIVRSRFRSIRKGWSGRSPRSPSRSA